MFDIAQTIQKVALMAVPFFLGITCHEVAHGYVSYLLGDPTAKQAGRLTLNPIKHLDPIGTLVLVLTQMIGWAKPVPIDPRYYRNMRKGIVLVSVAGPAANVLVAALFYAFYQLLLATGGMFSPYLQNALVSPLATIAAYGVMINTVLAVFNLIPIPPLDGSKILAASLPPRVANQYMSIERYGFIIILVLAVTGVFGKIFGSILSFIYYNLF